MCGVVSFKRGDSFYRTDKVTFLSFSPESCEATVSGKEDFHVAVVKDEYGDIRTQCTCPKLSSFTKDCQHIAAVLLAIYDHQRKGTIPFIKSNHVSDSASSQALTEGLLTLFHHPSVRRSGHQLHFENREELEVVFTCRPVTAGKGTELFAIDIKIGPNQVKNIRAFLQSVKEGKPCPLSDSFTYDPNHHCFSKESDTVIQQLAQVAADEMLFNRSSEDSSRQILIPPSAWEVLIPLVLMAPKVMLKSGNITATRLYITDGPLSLQFHLEKTSGGGHELNVSGFQELTVMEAYHSVISDGKIVRMDQEDSKRLSDLKQMLESSGTAGIPIPNGQLGFFLEKVVPGLRKLGDVELSDEVVRQFTKIPLKAKLYLDRVKNRLLAGLEFHYEHDVFNPLEGGSSSFYRDIEKEDEILRVMEESSFAKTEGGYFLHNEELEYEFLYHTVPKLEKLVQIYATTAVRNRIFRGSTFPKIRVSVKKERTNWLEFKFELGGIPEQEIRNILEVLEEKRKYYRLRNGSLFSLESREFAEINRFLHTVPAEPMDILTGVEMPMVQGLQLLDSVRDQEVLSLEKSFHQFFEELHNPSRLYEVPDTLEAILRDYQKKGYQWMKALAHYGFGGILADDMGLGKTLQSIAFIVSELPAIREKKHPILVVCPSSLTYNWLSELLKFAPEVDAVVVDGNKTAREKLQQELSGIDVVITSYPLLRRDLKWLEQQRFHAVFFDEAQAFKNPLTQTARTVKKVHADHRFALTGTPVENSPEELWAIFHVVFPGLFKNLEEFSHLTRKKIARRIGPFLLRRMKEEVSPELPGKVASAESVELLPEQKKLYAAYLAKLRHDTLKHLDKETIRKNRIKILAGLTRLRQICSHPALFVDGYKGSSAKFDQLIRIVEESRLAGRRVLIFSQFTKMLDLIGRALTRKGQPFFYLDGQTPPEERVDICDRFNRGDRDLFLISLKAGGTGLNLTGADTVILYDTWWNPAVEDQAMDRAHRIGQKNVVQVIKLFARGTIEEKMNELQEKKRYLVKEILDSEQSSSYQLTEEDIREILML